VMPLTGQKRTAKRATWSPVRTYSLVVPDTCQGGGEHGEGREHATGTALAGEAVADAARFAATAASSPSSLRSVTTPPLTPLRRCADCLACAVAGETRVGHSGDSVSQEVFCASALQVMGKCAEHLAETRMGETNWRNTCKVPLGGNYN
jgi:hypothetical protein